MPSPQEHDEKDMFQNVSMLVFDLDGTISDPSLGIARCLNYSLAEHGLSEVSSEQVAAAIGPPLDETFCKFQPGSDPSVTASLVAKYRERYAEVGYAENRLYPGMAEALQVLSSAGLRMGICTSKRRDFAIRILDMFRLRSHFCFVDGGDVGIKKREQLAGLLRSAQIDQNAIMIGDRAVDILSAKANGLRSAGVLWGFGDLAELQGAGADIILSDPSELRQVSGSGAP